MVEPIHVCLGRTFQAGSYPKLLAARSLASLGQILSPVFHSSVVGDRVGTCVWGDRT